MWSLSSLRRLSSSSSSLLANHGGLKFITYMPSRYAAFTPGWLGNNNGITRPDNVAREGSENNRFESSGNFRTNRFLFGEKENVPNPSSRIRSFLPTSMQKDFGTQNTVPMDIVKGVLYEDNSQPSRYTVEQNADIVHIKLKRNNSFVTLTDSKGNTKMWASSGHKEVAGGGKVGRYDAEATAEYVGRQAKHMGLKSVVVKVNGFTFFKKKRQAIMSFREGFTNSRSDQNPIVYIEDTTRRPHNGCRLPKRRRT
ncbi:hypothetical protein JCGZ_01641 [Jatropha curcas]|uniref:Ribosomal protein S11 n=1 Tax=Jatropha curcas TaxID=180498 RepID=A0A067L1N0_JATCU|nr:probable ribosomal protein S11, mitochondrial [Jatropha curcas]KDP42317.1 hypothetical protein JCGZ_01641 [Jatropha curcas]